MLEPSDLLYLQQFKQLLAKKYGKTSEAELLDDPQCDQELRWEVRKVQGRIPAKYRKFTLSQVTNPALKLSKEYVQDYIDRLEENQAQGRAPFLYGKVGTGKTLFGCVILMEAIKKNKSVCFTKVDECVNMLTSSWYDEDVKQEFNDTILSVEFLMIDDLGDEMRSVSSNLVQSTINKVLRTRADNNRPTILTSNLEDNKLKEWYDARTYSILKEHAIMIPCVALDHRAHVMAHKIKKDNPS